MINYTSVKKHFNVEGCWDCNIGLCNICVCIYVMTCSLSWFSHACFCITCMYTDKSPNSHKLFMYVTSCYHVPIFLSSLAFFSSSSALSCISTTLLPFSGLCNICVCIYEMTCSLSWFSHTCFCNTCMYTDSLSLPILTNCLCMSPPVTMFPSF